RRHTRWPRDWSSDVCSSDLTAWCCGTGGAKSYVNGSAVTSNAHHATTGTAIPKIAAAATYLLSVKRSKASAARIASGPIAWMKRSEERRVGKECGGRWQSWL